MIKVEVRPVQAVPTVVRATKGHLNKFLELPDRQSLTGRCILESRVPSGYWVRDCVGDIDRDKHYERQEEFS